MDVVLAFVSALFLALGTVLQQKAGLDEPVEGSSAGLLVTMAKRPVWLLGIACDGLGFVAQFAALTLGSLAVVQPIMVFSVVFALPLGAWLTHQRVTRTDLVAAAVVTIGILLFLVISDPTGGRDDAPLGDWLIVGAITLAVCAPLVLGGLRAHAAAQRAALLGCATGILFGLSAGLTDVVGHRLDDDVLSIFTAWPLYALVVVGYLSMTLSQMSLQTGALAPAVATQMALDPIVSVLLAVTILQETLHESTLGAIASTVALAVALGAMVLLARNQEGTVAAKPGAGSAVPAPT